MEEGQQSASATTTEQLEQTLTPAELAYFARHGCLVKRNVLDKQLCAHARDRMWAFAPEHGRLQRGNPASWIGPFPEEDLESHASNRRNDYTWKLRAPGGEAEILELIPVACRGIAEQLLGEGGVFPTPVPYDNRSGEKAGDGRRNTRGIYAQLPRGDEDTDRKPLREQPGAHFDSNIADDSMTHNRFMVTGLIDDTPAACPGFTLWPGSAPRLYALALQCRMEGIEPDSEEAAARIAALVEQIVADTEPVAVHGPAGTIVLWHRATLHSVGANYSDTIRQAIIYDFPAATAAPILLDEDGETTNVPDDDDALEKGGDGQAGPAWMAKWSEACSAAAGGSGEEDDEFNVEFMANSARLYDEAAGLSAKL